jgi:hypothetical protein
MTYIRKAKELSVEFGQCPLRAVMTSRLVHGLKNVLDLKFFFCLCEGEAYLISLDRNGGYG